MKKEQMFNEIIEMVATIVTTSNKCTKENLSDHLKWVDSKTKSIIDINTCTTYASIKHFLEEIFEEYAEIFTDTSSE